MPNAPYHALEREKQGRSPHIQSLTDYRNSVPQSGKRAHEVR